MLETEALGALRDRMRSVPILVLTLFEYRQIC
jgi:hypothetical protein